MNEAGERSTKKQQELFQYISDFIGEHGYGPSYREIMRGLNYKSVSTVAVHVNGLVAKGYLRKRDNSARSIEVVTPGSQEPADNHLEWLEQEIIRRQVGNEKAQRDAKTLRDALEILSNSQI